MIKVWKHLDYQATKYKFVFPKNEPNRKEAPPTWELCSVLTDSELEQFAKKCFEAGAQAQRLAVHAGTTTSEGMPLYTHIQAFVEFGEADFASYWAEFNKEK